MMQTIDIADFGLLGMVLSSFLERLPPRIPTAHCRPLAIPGPVPDNTTFGLEKEGSKLEFPPTENDKPVFLTP
jgi:hypothetical protein